MIICQGKRETKHQEYSKPPPFLLGGNWPLDHDDGSRYIIDRYNVVVYGGTKNYHGYEKQYYGNLFIRPDIGCGEVHCAVNDASGVIAPKSLNENWFNNTCITAGTPYSGQCDKPDPASSTSIQYANNTFLTPSGDPANRTALPAQNWAALRLGTVIHARQMHKTRQTA
jgi:hypothetical protein